MALELRKLQLEVEVTGTDEARSKLAGVERGIKGVEGAAKSTSEPLSKVTQALGVQNTALSDSASKLEQDTMAWMARNKALGEARANADIATKAQIGLSASITSVTSATGLSVAALGTLAAGLTIAAAGSTAMAAVLVKSTRHYFEHADATRDSRDALADLAKGWDSFQMMVGGAVLGDSFSIVKPVTALNAALQLTGGYIAVNIERTKEWALVFAQVAGMMPGLQLAQSWLTPNYTPPTDTNLPFQRRRDPTTGMTQDQFYAEAQIAVMQARMAKAEAERKKFETWWKYFQEHRPGVIPGLDVQLPGYSRVALPAWAGTGIAPGAGLFPGIPVQAGFPGNLGTSVDLPLWAQRYGQSNLLDLYRYRQMMGRPLTDGFWARGGGWGDWRDTVQQTAGAGPSWLAQSFNAGAGMRAGWNQGGFGGAATMALSGIQGGYALADATSEGGAGKRALQGALSGASMGTMIMPGIGTAIGAGVGALVGAIRGWLAPTEYELREKARHEQLGAIRGQIESMGGYGALERRWDVVGMQPGFNDNIRNMWDPKVIVGYLDELEKRTQRLNAAMEKYGISWEELGDKAKQAKIDDIASELIQDFDVLRGAGADTNFIIEKMGGSINDFVLSAKRTGTEVPSAMKPMIQKMIEMGLLTDDGGNAFKDLESTGIVFAKTMTQGFDQISAAIDRLAIALGYVPEKLNDITTAAGRAREELDRMGPGRDGPPDRDEIPRAHTGAFVSAYGLLPSFHHGGDVLARLQPGEFVMQRSAVQRYGVGTMGAMNSGRYGGGNVTIVFKESFIDSEKSVNRLTERIAKKLLGRS